jgi:hypothetical protein
MYPGNPRPHQFFTQAVNQNSAQTFPLNGGKEVDVEMGGIVLEQGIPWMMTFVE